jgi:hypothetical protein
MGIDGLQDTNDTAQDAELEILGLPTLLAIGRWIRVPRFTCKHVKGVENHEGSPLLV